MLRPIGACVASPPPLPGVATAWRNTVLIALVRAVCLLGAFPVAQAVWSDYSRGFYGLIAWNLGGFVLLALGAFLPKLTPATRLSIVLGTLTAYIALAAGAQGLTLTTGAVAVAAVGAAQLGLRGPAALAILLVALVVFATRAALGHLPGLPAFDRGDVEVVDRFVTAAFVYVAVVGGLAMAVQTVIGRLERGLVHNRRLAREIRERSDARGALARQVERIQNTERERLVGELYADLGRRLHDLEVATQSASDAVDETSRQTHLSRAERIADELAERVRAVSRRLAG